VDGSDSSSSLVAILNASWRARPFDRHYTDQKPPLQAVANAHSVQMTRCSRL